MPRADRRATFLILSILLSGLTILAAAGLVQMAIARATGPGASPEAMAALPVTVWLIAGAALLALGGIVVAWLRLAPRSIRAEGGRSTPRNCPGVLGAALLSGGGVTVEQEHKRLREQMFQQEKMVLIGQIAASVAHELNTPLGTILLRSQLVLRQLKDADDGQLADLRMIESEAQRCRKIIDSLLSFSRRSEGGMSETDMPSLIEESLSIIDKDLDLKGIVVESRHAEGAGTVCVDPNQIQQVLLNLVANAADAMDEGGTLRISTRPMPDRHMLEIRISDSGSGMSPEVLSKAMTPFFTTKGRGKGTGLGLAICQRIVEEHQGELEISSEVGRGTEVSIRLPQVPAKASEHV